MQIHLSDITDSEGKIIQFSPEVELDKISFQMGEFPILDRSPVELRIANTGNKVLELTGKGSLTVGIPCDRCLEQVSVTIPYDIDRKLDMKQTDKERVENLDENDYLTGMDLDVDRLVYLEVLMSWPLKVLCKEDCKGICSRCGKNLNEGPCGCAVVSLMLSLTEWKSNVKSVRVKTAAGGAQKMYVCTSCLRSGKVERA